MRAINRSVLASALVGMVLLLGACVGPPPNALVLPNTTGQQTSAPTPTPTPAATPAISTGPTLQRTDVEYAVYDWVADCARGVTAGRSGLRLAFDTDYDSQAGAWQVQAFTSDGSVTLGVWQVSDDDAMLVTAVDSIARQVAEGLMECAYPAVLMDGGATPPRFLPASRVPESQRPSGLIETAQQASIRVWSQVYACTQDFPPVDAFDAVMGVGGKWLVAGASDVASYGLWEVDADTGDVTPRDDRAARVAATCVSGPVALSEEQAAIRVWVATTDCFPQKPPLDAFEAWPEGAGRWVVEGREGSTLYGLWSVEISTGRVGALDSRARGIIANSCFQRFE